MWENTYGGLTLEQILIALAIIVGFVILAFAVRIFLGRIIKKATRKTKTKLDNVLYSALRRPVLLVIILAGFYIAVLTLPGENAVWSYTARIVAILLVLTGIYFVLVLLNSLLNYYKKDVAAKKKDVGFSLRLLNVCWIILIVIALWVVVIAVMGIWGFDTGIVTDWLGLHGWRIGLIVGLAMLMVVVGGEVVPRIVIHSLSRRPDENDLEVKKRSDTLSKVLVSTTQIFVFLIAIFMILSELTIDIAPILASAGVVGIAIGFGAQSMVKDIVAGLFIIIESQYRVGDVVKIADVAGSVESINLRRTVLRDIDGIVHTVPNGEIRVASNLTKEWSRVNLDISVAYGEDLDRVMQVINKVGQEMAEEPQWATVIVKTPQALRVNKFGDSGIEIKILGETQPSWQWQVTGELRLRLKRAFDKENIEIPWPHTKVFFGNAIPTAGSQDDKKD
jgi:small conductance mechanosensitive channel